MSFTLICLCLVAMASLGSSFLGPSRLISGGFRGHVLRMSDMGGGGDPLEQIRGKMAADPSYNPMSDPQAMQVLDSLIPQEMKDLPNAVERLKVAFTDATTGSEAIDNLDAMAAEFTGDRASLISSPSSKFFSGGMSDPGAVDENEKADLFKKLQQEYPDVPGPGAQ